MNLAGFWDAAEQDVGSDPARAPCRGSQRFSLLNDLADEEVLRDDEEVDDRKRFEIVVQE